MKFDAIQFTFIIIQTAWFVLSMPGKVMYKLHRSYTICFFSTYQGTKPKSFLTLDLRSGEGNCKTIFSPGKGEKDVGANRVVPLGAKDS